MHNGKMSTRYIFQFPNKNVSKYHERSKRIERSNRTFGGKRRSIKIIRTILPDAASSIPARQKNVTQDFSPNTNNLLPRFSPALPLPLSLSLSLSLPLPFLLNHRTTRTRRALKQIRMEKAEP